MWLKAGCTASQTKSAGCSDDAEPVGKIVNMDVPGPNGMVPVRIYYPRSFEVGNKLLRWTSICSFLLAGAEHGAAACRM